MKNTSGLKKGNPGNAGCIPGYTNKFRLACIKGLERAKAVEFATSVVAGSLQKRTVVLYGKTHEIEVHPTVDERIEAAKWLADRGHGKAVEMIESESLTEVARTILVRAAGKKG